MIPKTILSHELFEGSMFHAFQFCNGWYMMFTKIFKVELKSTPRKEYPFLGCTSTYENVKLINLALNVYATIVENIRFILVASILCITSGGFFIDH